MHAIQAERPSTISTSDCFNPKLIDRAGNPESSTGHSPHHPKPSPVHYLSRSNAPTLVSAEGPINVMIGWPGRRHQPLAHQYEREYDHNTTMPTHIRYQAYTFLVAGYDVDSNELPMLVPHSIVTEAGETQRPMRWPLCS
jgi:hypothetical protein